MIWHGVIINSVRRHRCNNLKCLSEDKFAATVKNYRGKISAIVNCQRTGTEEILEKVNNSGILTTSIVNYLISKRKAKDKRLRQKYLPLHQPDKLEVKHSRSFAGTARAKGGGGGEKMHKKQRAIFKQ